MGCGGGETIVRRNVFILMTAKGINVFSLVIITGMNITIRDEHDRMNMFTTTTTPTTGMFLCVIVYQSHCVLVLYCGGFFLHSRKIGENVRPFIPFF